MVICMTGAEAIAAVAQLVNEGYENVRGDGQHGTLVPESNLSPDQ